MIGKASARTCMQHESTNKRTRQQEKMSRKAIKYRGVHLRSTVQSIALYRRIEKHWRAQCQTQKGKRKIKLENKEVEHKSTSRWIRTRQWMEREMSEGGIERPKGRHTDLLRSVSTADL